MSKREKRQAEIAAKTARLLNSALGYLNAALGELEEAHVWASGRDSGLDPLGERELLARLHRALTETEGTDYHLDILSQLRWLRDRRAERVNFTFED